MSLGIDGVGGRPYREVMARNAPSDEMKLVERADRVARRLKTTRIAISGKLFNDGKKLDRLAKGGGVYHSVYVEADQTLRQMEREAGLNG